MQCRHQSFFIFLFDEIFKNRIEKKPIGDRNWQFERMKFDNESLAVGGGCCLLSFERSIDTQWHSCWSDRSTSRSTPSSAVGVVCFLVCLFFVVFWKILVFISSYPTFGRGRQPLGPTPAAYLTFPTPEVHFGSFNVHRCSRRTWLTTVNFRSLLPF